MGRAEIPGPVNHAVVRFVQPRADLQINSSDIPRQSRNIPRGTLAENNLRLKTDGAPESGEQFLWDVRDGEDFITLTPPRR